MPSLAYETMEDSIGIVHIFTYKIVFNLKKLRLHLPFHVKVFLVSHQHDGYSKMTRN